MSPTRTRLGEVASLIRSKNAGPFMLTIDIMFASDADHARVVDSGLVTTELIADIYQVDPSDVRITDHEAALALKISFPRAIPSGNIGDSDVFGGQFHGPLVDLELPATPR